MRLIAFLLLAAASLHAQRPRYGGVITVETREKFVSLDPREMPPEFSALVFERLVELDAEGVLRPLLAASWSHDALQRQWQFRLAERVAAHDGSIVTAQAVAVAIAPLLAGRTVGASNDVLVIQSPEPSPRLLFELAHPRNAIALRSAGGAVQGTGVFRIAEWEPGRRLALAAHEHHRAGRPFLDTVEILAGRSHADQMRDFELGRAHVVELLPADVRRQQQRGRRVWTSPPRETIALVWNRDRPSAQTAALRHALALSLDRQPMLNVLLQRQGETTGALLPQWLTGYAFLFRSARDLPRARSLTANGSPPLTLQCDPADLVLRPLADRIVLNARDAGIPVRVVPSGPADASLRRLPVASSDIATAVEDAARAAGAPLDLDSYSIEALQQAERRLLERYWIVPLLHVPQMLGVAPQVKDTTPPRSLRWRIEDAWVQP